MGYDVDLIPIKLSAETEFPVDPAEAKKLLGKATTFADVDAVRELLLAIDGCRPGPEEAVDYLGAGLSYARLYVNPQSIHVENNCGAKDLLKICNALQANLGSMFILDLQNGQLHSGDSFTEWWARPL